MGQYVRGDVVLASLSIDGKSPAKTRPAIIVRAGITGEVQVCPVSSRPPTDALCIPISLDDFAEGGLDLFGESYVMVSRVRMLRSGDVIGKKGRLTRESFEEIESHIPGSASKARSRENVHGGRERSG
ncbi:type II toxin-antitoxin system PemK/MazF family toxin [Methanoregula sp.]|uniref:type II toxin-antitoxin system PemK/MazF family toxin n=1 Tax=Methanoregula sp. TaxID=2052170 RepID=UPI003C781BDF